MAENSDLAQAAFDGDGKAVARLLAKFPSSVHDQDGMGFTALHWAADHGSDGIARMLLDAGASPDVPDMDGLTPLHYACIKGRLECARLMIPSADIDALDHQSHQSPLDHALAAAMRATMGFDSERGPGAEKIAQLLADEPARRASAQQAATLGASTGPGVGPAPKPRF